MNPELRVPYDKELDSFRRLHGQFEGKPISRWMGHDTEQRAVFVDETNCIGTEKMILHTVKFCARMSELCQLRSRDVHHGGRLGTGESI